MAPGEIEDEAKQEQLSVCRRLRAWGADGCRKGWLFVALGEGGREFGVVSSLEELVRRAAPDDPIFVDIPIGLPDAGDRGRRCDLEARRRLSPRRGSSVFPAPSRPAVYAGNYEEAQRKNREAVGKGLSKQTWAIGPKIREADELLRRRPELRGRLREAHPELCFFGLAGAPMVHSKKTRQGFRERLAVLELHLPRARDLVAAAFLEHGGFDAGRDDVVDATVVALCALHAGDCVSLPEATEVDGRGIPMEIVYWKPT